MTTYRISNTTSGTTLGEYQAESFRAALDAMSRDAGYDDYDHACEVTDDDGSDLLVEEIETAEPLTDDMIRLLRNDAAAAGDTATYTDCVIAFGDPGRTEQRERIAEVFNAARAQDDSRPFVRVTP